MLHLKPTGNTFPDELASLERTPSPLLLFLNARNVTQSDGIHLLRRQKESVRKRRCTSNYLNVSPTDQSEIPLADKFLHLAPSFMCCVQKNSKWDSGASKANRISELGCWNNFNYTFKFAQIEDTKIEEWRQRQNYAQSILSTSIICDYSPVLSLQIKNLLIY